MGRTNGRTLAIAQCGLTEAVRLGVRVLGKAPGPAHRIIPPSCFRDEALALEKTACFTMDVAAEPPEWIKLIPAGAIDAKDGRHFKMTDARAVLDATTTLSRLPLAVDYDHATDRVKDSPGEAPASGWIAELDVRGDGIYGRVEWTERGRKALLDREYRFISPVIRHLKDGTVTRILRAALTNDPALDMAALLSKKNPEEDEMDKELQALLSALGLDEGTDIDAIDAAINALKAKAGQTASLSALLDKIAGKDLELTALLGAQDDAARNREIDRVASQIRKDLAADGNNQIAELSTQLSAITAERAEEKATLSVDAAIKSGKLTPAMREWGLKYAKDDPEGFAEFTARTPTVMSGSKPLTPPEPKEGDLTATDIAICNELRISQDDFKKRRDAESQAQL